MLSICLAGYRLLKGLDTTRKLSDFSQRQEALRSLHWPLS